VKKEVKNLEELQAAAGAFLKNLSKLPQKNSATVVGLSGDLGAGKTAFTKCVASLLGITETVTSPTFILEKIYDISSPIFGERFTKLVHIDAYRLEGGDEMAALGWEALLADSHNLILIEWPEQVESALPKDIIRLSFKYIDEGIRSVEGELI
jgi:tRNA threonylcarbamoyladenosine biosynthesis protein TsaE